MKNPDIVVIKIPSDAEPTSQSQVFPRMPRLYLELMEKLTEIVKAQGKILDKIKGRMGI